MTPTQSPCRAAHVRRLPPSICIEMAVKIQPPTKKKSTNANRQPEVLAYRDLKISLSHAQLRNPWQLCQRLSASATPEIVSRLHSTSNLTTLTNGSTDCGICKARSKMTGQSMMHATRFACPNHSCPYNYNKNPEARETNRATWPNPPSVPTHPQTPSK